MPESVFWFAKQICCNLTCILIKQEKVKTLKENLPEGE
jgi:hypothetical protein